MALVEVAAPAEEPLDRAAAKEHLRVDDTADDTYIDALIVTARRSVENLLGRALVQRDFDQTLDCFPRIIRLERSPVLAIDSIKYLDESAVEQTLDPSRYEFDIRSTPARIKPAFGDSWPTTRHTFAAVTVRFSAGYGAAADVPADIVHGLKLMISHLYETREPVVMGVTAVAVPETIDALLLPHKIWMV